MPAYYVTTTVDLGAHSINVEMRMSGITKEDACEKAKEITAIRFAEISKQQSVSISTKSATEAK